jgi:LuxR family transcriptional regulator, maltose regulon positive regulatory protein
MSVLADLDVLPGRAAKANSPTLPASSVRRTDLLWRIAQAPQASVLLACAPAGYGKSMLLAQWAQSRRGPSEWVELDSSENDPRVLAQTLAGAFEVVGGGEREATLVLDNLERVGSPESLELLASLVLGLPAHLKLGLASRNVPPLHLDRLLAARRVLHLDTADLAMDACETRELLGALDIELEDGGLQALLARTEGWPAAVSLIAISLAAGAASTGEDAAHPNGRLPQEGAGASALERYIRDEVLCAVQGDARALAVRTSVLEELMPELCDAVLEARGTGRLLRELAACGATLRAQDLPGVSYRWHPIVRDALRAELATCSPEQEPDLHRRAGDWDERHGRIEAAIEHACAAGESARAGELLWDHAGRFLYGRDEQVERWLSMLTERQIASDPAIGLVLAHSSLALEDIPAARRWSDLARQALAHTDAGPRAPSLRAAAILIEVAAGEEGVERAAGSAARAQAAIESTSPLWPLAGLLRGVCMHLGGERDGARAQLIDAARERARATPLLRALSLAQLALIDVEEQAWSAAELKVAQARAIVREHSLDRRPACAMVYATSALIRSRRGLADEAKGDLRHAAGLLDSLGQFIPWFGVQTRIAMARTSARLADVVGARALLSAASHGARTPQPVPHLVRRLDEAWGELDELTAESLRGPCALTMAELRVLRFLPTHLSFREIGERLHVSSNTVKTQVHAIYSKLDVESRTEAVAQASSLGLIDAPVV